METIDSEIVAAAGVLIRFIEAEPIVKGAGRTLKHPDHATRLDPVKKRVKRIMAGYFRRQKKAILDDVRLRFWHHEMKEASGKKRAEELLPESLSPLNFQATTKEDDDYQAAIKSAIKAAQDQIASEVETGTAPVVSDNAMTKYLQERSLERLTGDFAETTKTRLRSAIADAVDAGGTADEIVAAIQDVMADFSTTRANLIAQTEVNDAYNFARSEMADEMGFTQKRWVTESGAPCLECDANEAEGWIDITEPFQSGDMMPTAHPMCLPGSAPVAAESIRCAVRRWYEGDVCILSLAGLPDLTITPNHPVLGPDGREVPAGLLKVGDNVFERVSPSNSAALVANPNDYHVESTIEQVFDSLVLAGCRTSRSMPVSSKAFHGDSRADDKVDIVWAAGDLISNLPDGRDDVHDGPLAVGQRQWVFLAEGRGHGELVGRSLPASTGLMCGGNDVSSLVRCVTGPGEALGFGAMSLLQAEGLPSVQDGTPDNASPLGYIEQAFTGDVRSMQVNGIKGRNGRLATEVETNGFPRSDNRRPTDTGSPTDRGDSFAVEVRAVQVLGVERRKFSGYVYNLETKSGWYEAYSIVVHNCPCALDFQLDTANEGK